MRIVTALLFFNILFMDLGVKARIFPPDSSHHDTLAMFRAAKAYKAKKAKNFLFGKHYREEWNAKVAAPVFNLKEHHLKVVKQGGSRETTNLRLEDSTGREYVLRSIDKTPANALPEDFRETFIANIFQDQTSTGHPYGAFTVPLLAEAAGVFHTNPSLVFVPYDTAFGEYKDVLANKPALFELRPDGPMRDLDQFGNPENVIGTDKMLEKRFEDHDNHIDEYLYARSRLFDMWLGDWSRHEDQWRWGEFTTNGGELFKPIPRDRDHVYFKFDGFLPSLVSRSWAVRHLRNFDCEIKDVKGLNWSARNLDRLILTSLTQDEWLAIADSLKAALTDSIIEEAIKQMPPSVFEISGKEIIVKLKSRREHLAEAARDYYDVLAKEVNIYGSDKNEKFQIDRNSNSTIVKVYKLNQEGEAGDLIYMREFYNRETDEVRVYGLKGDDQFCINGKARRGIKIRVVGGEGIDEFLDNSYVRMGEKKTKYYDSKKYNHVYFYKEAKDVRSGKKEDSIYSYRSDFSYNMSGPILYPEYNVDDGIFIGLGISRKSYGFRKDPYAKYHRFRVNFSTRTGAFNFGYYGDFQKIINHWNLSIEAKMLGPKYVINYFGFGNESQQIVDDINFYRAKAREIYIAPYLYQKLNKHILFGFGPFFETFDLQRTPDRFISSSEAGISDDLFHNKMFTGVKFLMNVSAVDKKIYPLRGIKLNAEAKGIQEISGELKFVNLYSDVSFFFSPSLFLKYVTFATRIGGGTNIGDFYFFQANRLGGTRNLRGFRRDRFYGRTSFFHNSEVRVKLFRVRTYLMPFKLGLMGFFDYGRVWADGEKSDIWHKGYGPGVWIEILNRALFSATYGFSPDKGFLNVQLGFLF